ncbi:MAG: hypothetical protein AAF389_14700 [Gemmatimonadota bacterium]
MKRSLLLVTLAALGAAACEDETIIPLVETLELSFTGLEPLANGFHYEGWAIINGSAVSTGKFNVDASGGLTTVGGDPIADGAFETGIDLSNTSAIVLTIEPDGDTDVIPADTHVLAGPVSSGMAALTAADGGALGDDFTAAMGYYILATPTDGNMDDENSGIWFLDNSSGSAVAGLDLPTLPAGWEYEGWAVINGSPVTTGRFTDVDMPDDAAPFSGSAGGPPFPGEDFLMNAPAGQTFPTDLAGGLAVISIEPEPDDSPAPYTFKPLMGPIDANAVDHVAYSMPNMATATFPTGTAVIR